MSLQLDCYLEERAAGASIDDACFVSGIDADEARLTEAAIAKGEVGLPKTAETPRATKAENEPDLSTEPRACVHVREGDDSTKEENVATQVRTDAEGNTGSAQRLTLFVERIENLHKERDGLSDDLKDVFAEAKSDGFDTNVMKTLIKRRKNGIEASHEFDALLEAYENAVQKQLPLPMQAEIRKPGSPHHTSH